MKHIYPKIIIGQEFLQPVLPVESVAENADKTDCDGDTEEGFP
jgi:hypothetical protein